MRIVEALKSDILSIDGQQAKGLGGGGTTRRQVVQNVGEVVTMQT